MQCKGCEDDIPEGPLCAVCEAQGLEEVMCEDCGQSTGDWWHPDEHEGSKCAGCAYMAGNE